MLCSFDHSDAQTIVEMLAVKAKLNATTSNRADCVFQMLLDRWSGVATQDTAAEPWWLVHRRVELVLAQAMLNGIPINGALTLDVGAGFGTDSAFYASRGARVVAMEPNFGLLSAGSSVHTELQWLGGSADAIPVADESMDIVTANASLHHHLNVRTSLDEMLRVLKPGGWMLTVADSVKGSADEDVEVDYEQWDAHPAVLSGINEQILRLDVLLDQLSHFGDAVAGEVFLRHGETGEFTRWTLSEAWSALKERPRLWGIMGMRVKKLRSHSTPPHQMRTGAVPTPELASAILEDPDPAAGYRLLGSLLSREDLRNSAPLQEVSRFLQLNGWRWPVEGADWRLVYRRGRLFMQPDAGDRSLEVTFAAPAVNGAESVAVEVAINGQPLQRAEIWRGQVQHWSLPFGAPCQPCSVTVEAILPDDPAGSGHVDPLGHLAIQRICFSKSAPQGMLGRGLFPRASLRALKEEGLFGQAVQMWAGGGVEAGLETLGALRRLGAVVCFHTLPSLEAYYEGLTEISNKPPKPDALVIFAGLSLASARELAAQMGLSQAWAAADGFVISLNGPDRFSKQLAAPAAPAEAQLERQLDKERLRTAEMRAKLAASKERIDRLKRESKRPKRTLWQRLRGV